MKTATENVFWTYAKELLRESGFSVNGACRPDMSGFPYIRSETSYMQSEFAIIAYPLTEGIQLNLYQSFPGQNMHTALPANTAPRHITCRYDIKDFPEMRHCLESFGKKVIESQELDIGSYAQFKESDGSGDAKIVYLFRDGVPPLDSCALESGRKSNAERYSTHHVWQENQSHFCINAQTFPLLPLRFENIGLLTLTVNFDKMQQEKRVHEITEGLPVSRSSGMVYRMQGLNMCVFFNKDSEIFQAPVAGMGIMIRDLKIASELFSEVFPLYREIYKGFTGITV